MDQLTDAVLSVAEGAPIEIGLAAAVAPVRGAVGLMAHRLNRNLDILHCGTVGVADELLDLLEARYLVAETNPVLRRLPFAPRERFAHAGSFTDWQSYLRSDLYEDYARPADCFHTGIILTEAGGSPYMAALGMRDGAEWPDEASLDRLRRDVRAVLRAHEASLARAACDGADWPGRVRGLVLDGTLRFWRLTIAEARALVRLGLLRRPDEGAVAEPLGEGRLGAAVRSARGGHAVRLVARAPDGEAYQLALAPGPSVRGERTVVVETEPLRPAAWDTDSLAEAFGLTCREAQVVLHLLSGGTTSTAADVLRLTRETLRTYLRAAYAKTGASGQCQLVALLNGAAAS